MTSLADDCESPSEGGNENTSILDVASQGYCVGCGACGVLSGGAVQLTLGPTRQYSPDFRGADPVTVAAVSKVCPFTHDSGGVASVSPREDWESLQRDPIIGRYRSIYTGRVADQRRILGSSSGGLTTWILRRPLCVRMR